MSASHIDKVTIVRGDARGTATRQAFEEVWADLGWELEEPVSKDATPETPAATPATPAASQPASPAAVQPKAPAAGDKPSE